ncbi:23S rRNA pseudouridine(2604) synthase RluF [Hymenobacter sp. HSC-4F20]|uniref:23S rRNA pseudouridine(2604) synthase RluF n=1 Tax=Hymenobacter sp. HSC-4F20 TaxID=2864135 RepID=UPI001C7373B6|nr:23S rRNA pseudouridine(2604) synthase RluF [Hymenobacter sp. HSC-4F20]MBX0290360.1 23S rRNA pseudouridine(2604) synthase RluF [Hymenobacter sp. HSC-4F20]
MAIRLNKFISESGMCSRREADRYIEQGQVLVNGKRASVGDQVTAKDRVMVNGNLVEPRGEEEAVYIAYNKPPGITTTTTAGIRDNIIRAIKHSVRLVPVGQLDKESQGLVLLTSSGELVNKILRASHVHENEYVVMLNKPITEQFLEAIAAGAGQPGAEAQNIRVTKDTPYIFRITLLHDTIRQIRRWCEQLGYEVVQMERIRVMNINVKALGVGEWRDLRTGELRGLLDLLSQPAPAGAASRRKRPSTATFWGERPATGSTAASTGEKKTRRPAPTPRPADEWLELPTEPKPARAPRSGSGQTPGTASGRRTGAAARPAGKAPGRPGGPRGAGAGKGSGTAAPTKTSNRGSRGASRGGKRS